MKKILFITGIGLWIFLPLSAQITGDTLLLPDTATLRLSYSEAKKRMMEENLSVLAAYYAIPIAEAKLEQSRLWNNPKFVWNSDMYTVDQNKYFKFRGFQKLIQVEFLTPVTFKRLHTIRGNVLGVEASKYAYADEVRRLVLEFSSSFTNLYSLYEKKEIYDQTLASYQRLLELFNKQYDLGIISQSELVRLNTEYLAVKTEATRNENDLKTEQAALNTMLNFPPTVKVIPLERKASNTVPPSYLTYIDSAKTYRPDYKLSEVNVRINKQDLKTQIHSPITDVKFGYQPHDRGSNYVRPYQGIVFEIDIPLFYRNQGGIKTAKANIAQSQLNYELADLELENEVASYYSQWLYNRQSLAQFSPEMFSELEVLTTSATENFQKKNISLLQYIDYQRSFLDLKLLYVDQQSMYLHSVNQLNFSIGKEITN